MGVVILTNVFIWDGIVDLNVYGFLDFPDKAMPFPVYYAKVIHGGLVAMYEEGFLKCSLYLSPNVQVYSPMYS